MTESMWRPKWDKRQAEVWERRPGAQWMAVHSGGLDSMRKWVKDRERRRLSNRFAGGVVEFVVLPVGEYPDVTTEPMAVVEVGPCRGNE